MQTFKEKYLDPAQQLTILDLGSMNVNGTYRPIFTLPNWTYIGADLESGPNVDLVLRDPYHWQEIKDNSLNVVVSGQAFEHIEFFWLTMLQIKLKLAPQGLCCMIAPSRGNEHRYPVDCWRFYPDGMQALARWSGLALLEVQTQWQDQNWEDDSDQWGDTWAVFQKKSKTNYKDKIISFILHAVLMLALEGKDQ